MSAFYLANMYSNINNPIVILDTHSDPSTPFLHRPLPYGPTHSGFSACSPALVFAVTLFDVLEAGWRTGQADDRELERRRRWCPGLCELSFYVCYLYTDWPRARRLVYFLPLSRHSLRYPSRTSSGVPRTCQCSTSQKCIKQTSMVRSTSQKDFPILPPHFFHQPPPYGSTHSGFSACSVVSHAHFWPHYSSSGHVGT